MRPIIVAIWAAASATPIMAQPPVRDPSERACSDDAIHLLILGTYHMGNPGLDAVNVHADDVLTKRRQSELALLNASLLKFRPKIGRAHV